MTRAEESLAKLRKYLSVEKLPDNSRLPTERKLCTVLGVSRSALREGLAVLEAEGKVWRHVGKGTFVGGRPAAATTDVSLVSQYTSPAEIMEVRLLIEPRIAGLAAMRAKSGDIAHMQRCLDKLDGALNKGDSADEGRIYDKWDGTLHLAIAEATHNSLLLSLFNAINSVRSLPLWGRLQTAAMTQDRWRLYGEQHRNFVDAIADRDPASSERRMRHHLETVQKNLLDALHSAQET
jgi:DNA-binding FadR family transcriptional regulator